MALRETAMAVKGDQRDAERRTGLEHGRPFYGRTKMKNAILRLRVVALIRALALASLVVIPAARAESSLADALAIIQGKEFVDLTHSFGPTTPVWSGFGQATMSAAGDPAPCEPSADAAR